jgi:hypothetical protein
VSKLPIPKSVPVGGVKVKILLVEEVDDQDSWAHYVHDKKLIRVANRAVRKGEFKKTLRHEMVHAALSIGGVAFSDYMEEESVVRCMDELFFPAWESLQTKYKILQ